MVVLNWYWFNPSSKFKTKTWSTPFTATSRETLVIWCIGVVIHGHVRNLWLQCGVTPMLTWTVQNTADRALAVLVSQNQKGGRTELDWLRQIYPSRVCGCYRASKNYSLYHFQPRPCGAKDRTPMFMPYRSWTGQRTFLALLTVATRTTRIPSSLFHWNLQNNMCCWCIQARCLATMR